jgi:hypothetical protein
MTALSIFLMSHLDAGSLVIAVTGYLIVFAALVLLFWLFNLVPRLISMKKPGLRRHPERGKGKHVLAGISGEETAAIAMALHLYMDELHDTESGVLTIKRISKTYSPWSSKIYAVRNQFNRL